MLVDVAKSALQAMTTYSWPSELHLPGYRPVTRPHAKQIKEAVRLILDAKRPVLYVGGGTIRAGRLARAAGAGEPDRHPGRDDADGPRSACPTATPSTSGCRACTARWPRSPDCSAAT